jgi:hypothetical protein
MIANESSPGKVCLGVRDLIFVSSLYPILKHSVTYILGVGIPIWVSPAVSLFTYLLILFLFLVSLGQVNKSSPKKPRSRNIFKALFCCLRAQDASQPPPPAQDTLLPPEDNGTIAKVTQTAPTPSNFCPRGYGM